jgi:hypothetical protein
MTNQFIITVLTLSIIITASACQTKRDNSTNNTAADLPTEIKNEASATPLPYPNML